MICSAYDKKDSPFIWIQFLRQGRAKKEYLKTTIRKDDPERERKIAIELNRVSRELLMDEPDREQKQSGWVWVGAWMNRKYRASPLTLKTYNRQWEAILPFFDEIGIDGPSAITREDCFAYIDWRTAQVKEKSKKNISINTALAEVKLLGMILDEGIKRGLLAVNHARKMGIAKDDPSQKPELTDDDLNIIRSALKTKPEWMRISFEIAMETGLRFSDTRLPRSAVNLAAGTIHLEKPKGGRGKAFSIPIYRGVRPMVEEFMKSKKAFIWSPSDGTPASIHWMRFWSEVGITGACFHCSRVTFVTRGMRAGIPESVMMKMVNHGSKMISRIYQRWNVSDVLRFADLITPTSDGAMPQNLREKSSRETSVNHPA